MAEEESTSGPAGMVKLPVAKHISALSVEQALRLRRSIREYAAGALPLPQLSQVLWAAQGVTGAGNIRTTPSAGEHYPVRVYAVVGQVDDLEPGVYRYESTGHFLTLVANHDRRDDLAKAALNQEWVRQAPVSLVLTVDYSDTIGQYGERGQRYVLMEAGHVGQNIHLQAASLQLGTVLVGAFSDSDVKEAIGLNGDDIPVCIVPLGEMD